MITNNTIHLPSVLTLTFNATVIFSTFDHVLPVYSGIKKKKSAIENQQLQFDHLINHNPIKSKQQPNRFHQHHMVRTKNQLIDMSVVVIETTIQNQLFLHDSKILLVLSKQKTQFSSSSDLFSQINTRVQLPTTQSYSKYSANEIYFPLNNEFVLFSFDVPTIRTSHQSSYSSI